ncbi:MAG: GatB/YqeY domain-containing protein, partial [Bacteroidetes bacterium]|nr:GatB/YqeY domain-containing protein [Bacteroidota bacterium]
MALKQKIDAEIKSAMIAKDKARLTALRAIKSLILLEETKEGFSGELGSEEELKLLTKAAKQRKDSAEIYEKQGRKDLLEVEIAELAVIQEFLP